MQKFGVHYWSRLNRKETFFLNGLAIIVGILAGYAAILFRATINFFQNLFMHHEVGFDFLSPMQHNNGVWVVAVPAIGFLVVAYIVKFFASEAKGHGVPEVIEAVMIRGGKMRKRIVGIKALVSSITIASGGSVGKEGPIVQIGAAGGSALGQILKIRPKLLRTLVGCGAAGAVAAAFNTPIAGVVFAVEVIVLELKTRSFIPLVISAVFATIISRYYLGDKPAFLVPSYELVSHVELIFYLGLGLLSGVIGVLTIRTLYKTEDIFQHAPIPFFAKPLIGGTLLGFIGLYYPQIFGVGYDTMDAVLTQSSSIEIMLPLIFLKIIAMSLTLAAGGSGGVFAPSLYIGAVLGGSYGWFVHKYFPEFSAGYGAYALVGMAAMFSATCRAAFTAIVILFEMTLDYSIILPLMFVCVVADQTALILFKETMYSLKLKRKGISYVTDIGVSTMAVTPVREIMTRELVLAQETMTVKEAHDHILIKPHAIYPVVDFNGHFKGIVRARDLWKIYNTTDGPQKILKEIMTKSDSVVDSSETTLNALKKLEKSRDPRIFVVDERTKVLQGLVSPTDIIRLSSKDLDS